MTMWMAKFLTVGDTYCEHEPLIYMDRKEDIKHFYDVDVKNIGLSDSGSGFFLDWIMEEIQPRTLIIERDIADVEKSLCAMGLNLPKNNFCQVLQSKMDSIDNELVMRVKFDKLLDIKVMQKCFFHLLPCEIFDEGRFKKMIAEKIEVNPQTTLSNVMRNKGKLFNSISHLIRNVNE